MTETPMWGRVKGVFQAALEREPAERAAFLLKVCGDDDALREEAGSLLAAFERAGTFIERPALESLTASAAFATSRELEGAGRALQAGDALGQYEVLECVGAGGMGEVYRAHDRTLNRDVALKVQSGAFAFDRLARLKREAQFLASLNHPNIAAIYGLEELDGIQALVLEHVDGPTLAQRIDEAAVRIDEALTIAKQVAKGLEAAHARGIVHRDLKPANIKLRPDGTVKILDFGLAKGLDPSDSSRAARDTATMTSSAMARAGVVFGTAAYMSPEQASGQPVDKRTDIWAFGCVLYETLVGRSAFRGETIQETLAAVLGREPDWNALPIDTPATVSRLLRRCLEKDPARRLHDIADARIEIEDAGAARPMAVEMGRRRRSAWALGLTVVALTVVALTAVGGGWLRPVSLAPAADRTLRRLQIRLPEAESLADAQSMPLGLGQPSLAISPDGTRLAYVLERRGLRQLYLRALDQLDGAPIPKTEGAFGPFFSPDSLWIGFFADNKLKKVATSGGDPIVLCDAPNPYGGSWGTDGTILFSPDEGRRPTRVPDTGGTCQPVLLKNDQGSWTQPHVLPGGQSAIVTHTPGVGVLSLETGEYHLLVENAGDARYASSGHLVFARAGALLAAPFDLERLALGGPATVVLEGIRMEGQIAVAQAAFSRDGTLVYAPGRAANDATRPVWVDREGRAVPVGMPPRSYRSFSLSPDGRRLAIVKGDPNNDVWVQDLERGSLTRLTAGGNNVQPKWTPDGTRVLFSSIVEGRRMPLWVPADGSGEPEAVFKDEHRGGIGSFSPKGDVVAFNRRAPDTGLDLWVRPLNQAQAPQPFVRTRFTEVGPAFSPDGRYIAYVSDESGQYEVFVRPYPPSPGKWQVSTAGGEEEIWSRDGRELFYRNGNKWMVVPVSLRPEFKAGTPRLLFEGPYVNVGGLSYDVTPDGRRFLLLEPVEHAASVTHLNVVLNWFEEVKQKSSAFPPGQVP